MFEAYMGGHNATIIKNIKAKPDKNRYVAEGGEEVMYNFF
ncbi:hypothetical protein JCM15415_17520 [Methanobacterium movens]